MTQEALVEKMMNILRECGWCNPGGKRDVKKQIKFPTRNMVIENIHLYPDTDMVDDPIVVFSFDVVFRTENEEAMRTYQSTFGEQRKEGVRNLKDFKVQLKFTPVDIRKQLIFTDKIDMNLYTYNELDKKGWKIIKRNKPVKK